MRTSLLPAYGLATALMLVFTLAACDGGGDGGGSGPYLPTAWVWIKSHQPQGDIMTASSVTLLGSAECDNCPSDEEGFGYCPAEKPSPPTAINVTVINQTTGQSAGLLVHEIGGECSCLFSYCMMIYAHRWAAYDVPLTWGENVIVATASGPGFDPGTDSITITRVPGTVGNLKATPGKQQVTLSWDPVPDAASYNIYWSTTPITNTSQPTGTLIAGVTSPYTHTGLVDGQTYYYIVTSARDAGESLPSSVVVATPGWVVESVATTARGTITSLVTDSSGKVHIHYSYVERTATTDIFHSYYVTNMTGTWPSLLVDQSSGPYGTLHANANIALDSQNTVQVSFVNSSGLTHAIYASGAWLQEVIDPSATCNASLAIDSDNKAHIVYFTPTGLRYATNRSGGWTNSVIPGFDFPPDCHRYSDSIYVALGVDAAGAAHIAYISFDRAFRYATNRGGSWTLYSFGQDLFTGLALAVTPSGIVHIVYGENTSYALHYRHNTSGAWTNETIDNSGYFPSLRLDANGKAHVSFWHLAPYDLRYASNSSGTWHSTTIEPATSIGNTDIAVDSQGKAHISFSTNESVRYATNK